MKNLLKSCYLYTLPSDVRCSTDVWSFLIARMSGHFRTSDTSTTETFLRMSGTLGRPTLSHQKHSYGCPTPVGRPYPVHWIVGHTFHSGRSSNDCRRPDPFGSSDVRRSPDVRPSCTPNGHFFSPPIYTPFPSTG